MFVDTSGDTSIDLATFYERFLAEDLDAFQITADFARGLHALEQRLKEAGRTYPFVKVQTTGPITFGLAIVDENKRAIYYNPEFVDVIVKGMAMKCRWQIRRFKPFAEQVICFLDEPILSAFGSSTYVSVTRDDVVSRLNEVVEAIHGEGALAGIHCCGNTDWAMVIDAGVDIVNLDAFDFGETIALYGAAVKRLLDAGSALAWGIVPTKAEEIRRQTTDSLVSKLDGLVENLARTAQIDREQIYAQAMVTPSCGLGSTPVAEAERALELLRQTSLALRERLDAAGR